MKQVICINKQTGEELLMIDNEILSNQVSAWKDHRLMFRGFINKKQEQVSFFRKDYIISTIEEFNGPYNLMIENFIKKT